MNYAVLKAEKNTKIQGIKRFSPASQQTSQDTLHNDNQNSLNLAKNSSKNLNSTMIVDQTLNNTPDLITQGKEVLPPLMKAKGIFKNKHIDVLVQQQQDKKANKLNIKDMNLDNDFKTIQTQTPFSKFLLIKKQYKDSQKLKQNKIINLSSDYGSYIRKDILTNDKQGTTTSKNQFQVESMKLNFSSGFQIQPPQTIKSSAQSMTANENTRTKTSPSAGNQSVLITSKAQWIEDMKSPVSSCIDGGSQAKIRMNQSFKFNLNQYQNINLNVRPNKKNYLIDKLERKERKRREEYVMNQINQELEQQKFVLSAVTPNERIRLKSSTVQNSLNTSFNQNIFVNNKNKIKYNPNIVIEHHENAQASQDFLSSPGLRSSIDKVELKGIYQNSNNNTKQSEVNYPQDFLSGRISQQSQARSIITPQRFDFQELREHRKSISQSKLQEAMITSILSQRNEQIKQSQKPIFLVNRKPKTSVVNQRSCFSKEITKMSYGDQYRGIQSLTKRLNLSLQHDINISSYTNSKVYSPQQQHQSIQKPNAERANNRSFSINVNPQNIMKLKQLKKEFVNNTKKRHFELINLYPQNHKVYSNKSISVGTQILTDSQHVFSQQKIKIVDQNESNQEQQRSETYQGQQYQQQQYTFSHLNSFHQTTYDNQQMNSTQKSNRYDIQHYDAKSLQNQDDVGKVFLSPNIEDLEKIKEDSAESYFDTTTQGMFNNQIHIYDNISSAQPTPQVHQMVQQSRSRQFLEGKRLVISSQNQYTKEIEPFDQNTQSIASTLRQQDARNSNSKISPSRIILQKKNTQQSQDYSTGKQQEGDAFDFKDEKIVNFDIEQLNDPRNRSQFHLQQQQQQQQQKNLQIVDGGSQQSSFYSKEGLNIQPDQDYSTYAINEHNESSPQDILSRQFNSTNNTMKEQIAGKNYISAQVKKNNLKGQMQHQRQIIQQKSKLNKTQMGNEISSFQISLKENLGFQHEKISQKQLERQAEINKNNESGQVSTARYFQNIPSSLRMSTMQTPFGLKIQWKDRKPMSSYGGRFQQGQSPGNMGNANHKMLKSLDVECLEKMRTTFSQFINMVCTCRNQSKCQCGYQNNSKHNHSKSMTMQPGEYQFSRQFNHPFNFSNQAIVSHSRKSSINTSQVASIERPVVDIKIKGASGQVEMLSNYIRQVSTSNERKNQMSSPMAHTGGRLNSPPINEKSQRQSNKEKYLKQRQINFKVNVQMKNNERDMNNSKSMNKQIIRGSTTSPFRQAENRTTKNGERKLFDLPTSIQEDLNRERQRSQKPFGITGQKAKIRIVPQFSQLQSASLGTSDEN